MRVLVVAGLIAIAKCMRRYLPERLQHQTYPDHFDELRLQPFQVTPEEYVPARNPKYVTFSGFTTEELESCGYSYLALNANLLRYIGTGDTKLEYVRIKTLDGKYSRVFYVGELYGDEKTKDTSVVMFPHRFLREIIPPHTKYSEPPVIMLYPIYNVTRDLSKIFSFGKSASHGSFSGIPSLMVPKNFTKEEVAFATITCSKTGQRTVPLVILQQRENNDDDVFYLDGSTFESYRFSEGDLVHIHYVLKKDLQRHNGGEDHYSKAE